MSDIFTLLKDYIKRSTGLAVAIQDRTPKLARYLPAIYQPEAEKELGPLWALLLLMEDNFDSISSTIDEIDKYFDIRRAPAGNQDGTRDFVTWLGSWIGLIPQKQWSEQKKRYALSIAVDLHRCRGTIDGLKYMIALFFGIDVELEEWAWPDGMQIDVKNTIAVDTCIDDRYNINFCFKVTWRPTQEDMADEFSFKQKLVDIRAMIDREKPTHTWCYFDVAGFDQDRYTAFGEVAGGENKEMAQEEE